MNWDKYFMSMAFFVAMKSKDKNTQVGTVIVGPDHEIVSTGFNGLPRGADDSNPDANIKPMKYLLTEHSERNSLYNACRMGVKTLGCTMYTGDIPCADCARAIVQSGIKRLVTYRWWQKNGVITDDWKASLAVAEKMLTECGVKVDTYDGPLVNSITNLYQGKVILLPGEPTS